MTAPRMSLDVLLSPAELPESVPRDHQVVVIDVLRASTVIAQALAAGAARVIAASSIEEALALKAQIDPEGALLCGEREGRPIAGFDLGNSPLEYRPEVVRGRTLILASTNGSLALVRSQAARRVLVVSWNTLGAVARRMVDQGGAWTIVCSGKLGRPCLEDLVCAGSLIERLAGLAILEESGALDRATDGVRIARDLHARYGDDPKALLTTCAHGRYLISLGYGVDLDVAAGVDTLDIVPEQVDGRIVIGAAESTRAATPARPAPRRRRTPAGDPPRA